MALFSDIDWVILLAVGAFLLFGKENRTILRTLGRYYGRAVRLKQELLAEVTGAAAIPLSPNGHPASLRSAFLGLDGPGDPALGPPEPLTRRPPVAAPELAATWVGVAGSGTWSVALPPAGPSPGRSP